MHLVFREQERERRVVFDKGSSVVGGLQQNITARCCNFWSGMKGLIAETDTDVILGWRGVRN